MSRMVKLNVGGVQYTTSASTIAQYPDSMLAVMIEKENERHQIESGNELFIDRNGHVFKFVLEFLRNGDGVVLPRDKNTQRELALEAEFYQLDGLKCLIDESRKKYSVGEIVLIQSLISNSSIREKISGEFARFFTLGNIIGTVVDILECGDLVVEFSAKLASNKQGEHLLIDKYRDVSIKYVIPVEYMHRK